MKKQILLIFLALALLLSACGEEHEALETLNPEDWPTVVPTEAIASATPFPKQAAELLVSQMEATASKPTATPTAAPTETPLPATATPVPPTATAQASPTATATPALSGLVNSIALNVRSGPNATFEVVGRAPEGDSLVILAQDSNTGWVNVKAPNGMIGWVNPNFLSISGNLSAVQGATPQDAVAPPTENGATSVSTGASASNQPASTGENLLLQLTGGGQIVLLNRDGSNIRPITSGIDPALSPDGSKIAFTRWDGADVGGSLWVANVDGSDERHIAGEIKQVKSPSWSPDSQQIAVNFQEGGRLDVATICWDLAKGDPPLNYWQAYDIETKIEFDEFGRPTVYLCWKLPPDPHWKLRIIDVADGSFEDMPAGQYAFAPTWDPANPWRVVSVAQNGLVWTDIERGVAQQLTTDPSDRGPVFSPDGKYIAVTYKQDNHWDIHRLNADGTGRVRLTKTPLYNIVESTEQWNNASPVFSPDGTQIAFLTDRTGRWEIWLMDIDGANQRPMFSDAVNDQLHIEYNGNDERALGWGRS